MKRPRSPSFVFATSVQELLRVFAPIESTIHSIASDIELHSKTVIEDVAAARELAEPKAVELAERRLGELSDRMSEFVARVPAYESAANASAEAASARDVAFALEAQGSDDRETAIRLHQDLVAAQSKCRVLEREQATALADMRGPVDRARVLGSSTESRRRNAALEGSRRLVELLFSESGYHEVYEVARDQGKAADVVTEAFWSVAEHVAEKEFMARAEQRAARAEKLRVVDGSRRELTERDAQVSELRNAFANRRAALESKRAAARKAVADLETHNEGSL